MGKCTEHTLDLGLVEYNYVYCSHFGIEVGIASHPGIEIFQNILLPAVPTHLASCHVKRTGQRSYCNVIFFYSG